MSCEVKSILTCSHCGKSTTLVQRRGQFMSPIVARTLAERDGWLIARKTTATGYTVSDSPIDRDFCPACKTTV